jgi:hypothetical protein
MLSKQKVPRHIETMIIELIGPSNRNLIVRKANEYNLFKADKQFILL